MNTMDLQVSGPEQIRAAFTTAIDTTSEHLAELAGIAGVLGEAADRYETLQMTASTLEHLREGATAVTAAAAALGTAGEQLRAALADFNGRDGRVGDAVTEAGNLMQPDGYTTTFDPTGAPAVGGRHRAPENAQEATVTAPDPHAASRGDGAPDPLRLARRIVLADGESFAGSGSVKDNDGILLLAAAVDTPHGRQVHVGVPIFDEDRKNWRGANAPAQETAVDEDDEEPYQIDTGSQNTVVLDAADAATLPAVVDTVISRATEVDKEYKQLLKESDRLDAARSQLEAKRFGSDSEGRRKMDAEARVDQGEHYQRSRRRSMDAAVDRLPAQDRARYDDLQRQIDQAGQDAWEPGKEAEAATVCGLTEDEFAELRDLGRIPWRQRSAAQTARHDELKFGAGNDSLHPAMPPLLAEQAAIVCGLTVDEFREMEALERIPEPHRDPYFNRRRVRTPQEQARLDDLHTSPRGATGATARQTHKLRTGYLSGQQTHHSSKFDVAEAREHLAAIDATARPLAPSEAADLRRITTELNTVNTRMDELGGWTSATAEIPARNGGALVVEATQKDEYGGVTYTADRKPADADDDWTPGNTGDPFSTTPAGLRKLAKLAAALATRSDKQPA
jgi:hypothetical protein